MELLKELGLLVGVLDKAYHVRTIGIYDGKARRAEMRILGKEDASLPLAVMRQDVLEHVLEEALKRAGFEAIQRIIREDEPPKPSTRLASMLTTQIATGRSRTRWTTTPGGAMPTRASASRPAMPSTKT